MAEVDNETACFYILLTLYTTTRTTIRIINPMSISFALSIFWVKFLNKFMELDF